MSSIITDKLPKTVIVCNKGYSVNSDFRLFIGFETDIAKADKSAINAVITRYLEQFYCGNIPGNVNEAVSKLLWFYKCGQQIETNSQEPAAKCRHCYNYKQDAQYIYAAFLSQYGIDLNTAELHWWTFKALFSSLPSDCMIVQIMQYRATDASKIKNQAERTRILKLQDAFRLRDDRIKRYANAEEHDKALKAKVNERYEQALRQIQAKK